MLWLELPDLAIIWDILILTKDLLFASNSNLTGHLIFYLAAVARNLFRSNPTTGGMPISNSSYTEFCGNHKPLVTYPLSADKDPLIVSSFLGHRLNCT